jgi:transcriptional regulator with XRE-family HTH domain
VHNRSVASYETVVAHNVKALRGRADLNQDLVAERMRALGYEAWIRQTVANVEKGRRRLTAGEIHALAWALSTTTAALLNPIPDDKIVEFPAGGAISVYSVQQLTAGLNLGAVAWRGGGAEPVFIHIDGAADIPEAQRRHAEIEAER